MVHITVTISSAPGGATRSWSARANRSSLHTAPSTDVLTRSGCAERGGPVDRVGERRSAGRPRLVRCRMHRRWLSSLTGPPGRPVVARRVPINTPLASVMTALSWRRGTTARDSATSPAGRGSPRSLRAAFTPPRSPATDESSWQATEWLASTIPLLVVTALAAGGAATPLRCSPTGGCWRQGTTTEGSATSTGGEAWSRSMRDRPTRSGCARTALSSRQGTMTTGSATSAVGSWVLSDRRRPGDAAPSRRSAPP